MGTIFLGNKKPLIVVKRYTVLLMLSTLTVVAENVGKERREPREAISIVDAALIFDELNTTTKDMCSKLLRTVVRSNMSQSVGRYTSTYSIILKKNRFRMSLHVRWGRGRLWPGCFPHY